MTILKIKALVSRNRPLILVTVTLTTIFAVFQNCNQLNVPASTQNGLTTSHLPLQPQQQSSSSSAPSLNYDNLPSTAGTWSSPAIAQYDSGPIAISDALTMDDVIIAADNQPGNFGINTMMMFTLSNYQTALINPTTQTQIVAGGATRGGITGYRAMFIGSTYWPSVTKIKLYTNLSATDNSLTFALYSGGGKFYYRPGNNPPSITDYYTNGPGESSSLYGGSYLYCENVVPGATLPAGAVSANIGDPGTCYQEITVDGSNNDSYTTAGVGYTLLNGALPNPYSMPTHGLPLPYPATVQEWQINYVGFDVQPRAEVTGFQYRFMIEHE